MTSPFGRWVEIVMKSAGLDIESSHLTAFVPPVQLLQKE